MTEPNEPMFEIGEIVLIDFYDIKDRAEIIDIEEYSNNGVNSFDYDVKFIDGELNMDSFPEDFLQKYCKPNCPEYLRVL